MEKYFRNADRLQTLRQECAWMAQYFGDFPGRGAFIQDEGGEPVQELIEALGASKREGDRYLEDLIAGLEAEEQLETEKKYFVLEKQIGDLFKNGNLTDAKKIISDVPVGRSGLIDKWRRAVTDPIVTSGGPASGKDFRKDFSCIEQNSRQYRGLWIAVRDGEMLGSHKSRLALQQELEQSGALEGATFFKVEE